MCVVGGKMGYSVHFQELHVTAVLDSLRLLSLDLITLISLL